MTDPLDPPLGFADLPEALRARVEAELGQGERLLWADRPDPRRPRGPRRRRGSHWAWTFGMIFLTVAATVASIGLGGSLRYGTPNAIGWAVMVATGSGAITIVIATFLVADYVGEGSWRWRGGLDLYALTDRRALIWEAADRSSATRLVQHLPRTIESAHVERLEYPGGLGDLLIQSARYGVQPQGIFGVKQIRRVDELFRLVLVKPSRPRSNDSDKIED